MKSVVRGERIVLCHAIPGFSDASELACGKCSRCSLRLSCEAAMKRMELPASGAALQPLAVRGGWEVLGGVGVAHLEPSSRQLQAERRSLGCP